MTDCSYCVSNLFCGAFDREMTRFVTLCKHASVLRRDIRACARRVPGESGGRKMNGGSKCLTLRGLIRLLDILVPVNCRAAAIVQATTHDEWTRQESVECCP